MPDGANRIPAVPLHRSLTDGVTGSLVKLLRRFIIMRKTFAGISIIDPGRIGILLIFKAIIRQVNIIGKIKGLVGKIASLLQIAIQADQILTIVQKDPVRAGLLRLRQLIKLPHRIGRTVRVRCRRQPWEQSCGQQADAQTDRYVF